jgi:hypothetical protein
MKWLASAVSVVALASGLGILAFGSDPLSKVETLVMEESN